MLRTSTGFKEAFDLSLGRVWAEKYRLGLRTSVKKSVVCAKLARYLVETKRIYLPEIMVL